MYVRAIYIPLRKEISSALRPPPPYDPLFILGGPAAPPPPFHEFLPCFLSRFPRLLSSLPRRRYPRVCDHRADVLPNCLCFYHARTFPRPPPTDPGPSVAPRLNERPRVPGCVLLASMVCWANSRGTHAGTRGVLNAFPLRN